MSEFEAKKLNVANINSGQKYQNGDGLQAKSFNELVEATLQNSNDIDFIDMILEGSNIYAELELSEAYTSRFTANGANIFDGQLTPIESIRGSTVKNKNLVIVDNHTVSTNNNAYSLSYPTKTTSFRKGETYTWAWDYKIVSYVPSISGAKLGFGLVVLDNETGKTQTIYYSEPYSNQAIGILHRQKATFVSPYNGELRYFWFISTYGTNTTTLEISNVIIEEGATNGEYIPYFTGLKNANINSIVSTGKNLFNTKSDVGGYRATAEIVSASSFKCIAETSGTCYVQFYNKLIVGKTYTIFVRTNTTELSGSLPQVILSREINAQRIYRTLVKITTSWKEITFTADEEDLYLLAYGLLGGSTLFQVMLVEGEYTLDTMPDFEDYIEYTYQLPQTVELAEYDIINPPEQTLTRYTETIVFETTSDYWEMTSSGIFKYTGYLPETPDIAQTGGFCVCNLFAPVSSQNPNGSCGIGVDGYFVVIKQDINSLEDFLSYLQTQETNGNPLILAYKTAEPVSSVTFSIPQSYEVYKGGTETIVQGTTDNSEYGAKPTITQTYIGKVGE